MIMDIDKGFNRKVKRDIYNTGENIARRSYGTKHSQIVHLQKFTHI